MSKNKSTSKKKEAKKEKKTSIVGKSAFYSIACLGWIFFSIYAVRKLKLLGIIKSKIPFEDSINATFDTIDARIQQWNETFHDDSQEKQMKERYPGYILSQEGAKAKYPVVMIPGFTSSTLEVWKSKGCSNIKFRQGLWADYGMLSSFFTDSECWKEHLTLDPFTGLDPEEIKIRSAEGIKGADYFLGNFWVWAKIIQNLAYVGYTPSEMRIMPYDWRLAFTALEKRDGYFSEIKAIIEYLRNKSGEKVVLMGHSMGGLVAFYFFNFVSQNDKDWVENHIHAFVDIGRLAFYFINISIYIICIIYSYSVSRHSKGR